jgi:hypothetical protein
MPSGDASTDDPVPSTNAFPTVAIPDQQAFGKVV